MAVKWNIKWGERICPLPQAPFVGRHLIDGEWRDGGALMECFSPGHGGGAVGVYPDAGAAECDAAIAAARRAFESGVWREMPAADKARRLSAIADAIENRATELAIREALESGKPVSQAQDEMRAAADLWRYAAALCRTLRGDSYNALGGDMLGLVLREPVGVVVMIAPWNFPLLIVSQKLPFALAAGCAAVIKPSELTCGTTVMLGEMLREADIPPGTVNIVLGRGRPAGEALLRHPDADMISFTGSTRVGREVIAASAAGIKKVSLELGGKNPQVIFPDCDWDAMVDAVVFGVCFNAGECCNSGSRALVHAEIADDFIRAAALRAAAVAVGDPLHPATKMGAIISEAHLNKIQSYADGAVKDGAIVALGGGRLSLPAGRYFEPTIIRDVAPEMAIAREEVFGPVLAVLTFRDADEAAALANDCCYGLSAGVWSRDLGTCVNFARRARAGTVWVNSWMDGYAELPFGGFRQSGLGRELGRFGAEEYTELKTVQIRSRRRALWLSES